MKWNLKVPQRCKTFLCLALQERLITNELRRSRGMCDSSACSACESGVEDVIHVLRDCPVSQEIWYRNVRPDLLQPFFELGLQDWFKWNFSSNVGITSDEWAPWFSIVFWLIWRRRNERIFQNENVNLVAHARGIVRCMTTVRGASQRSVLSINPPSIAKIFIDGAFSRISGAVGRGGVFKDQHGDLEGGFILRLTNGDALSAEIWAIIMGLKCAWDKGLRECMLLCDSVEAISAITVGNIDLHEHHDLILEARAILQRDWNVRIQFIPRDGNLDADWCAKMVLNSAPGLHFLQHEEIFSDAFFDPSLS